ncbi:MAG: nucleotidyltransferase domain-containing protein [Thermoplasmata archaeon]
MRYNTQILKSPVFEVLGKESVRLALSTLQAYPVRYFTINELAREAGVPVMSCWRAVKDLEKLGVVAVRRIGKSDAVSLNGDSSILKALTEFKEPYIAAAEKFAKNAAEIDGLKFCYLFGSVAKGVHKLGSDIDIALVYDDKFSEKKISSIVSKITWMILDEDKMRITPFYISVKDFEKGDKKVTKDIKDGILLWPKSKKR